MLSIRQLKMVAVLTSFGLMNLFLFQNCGEFKAKNLLNEKTNVGEEDDSSKNPVVEKKPVSLFESVGNRTYLALLLDDLTLTKDDDVDLAARSAYASTLKNTGAWYFEAKVIASISGDGLRVGVASQAGRVPDDGAIATISYGLDFLGNVTASENGSSVVESIGDALVAGDVIGIYVNLDGPADVDEVIFFVNGTFVSSQQLLSGQSYSPFVYGGNDSNGTVELNFGATPFAFTPASLDYEILD